MRTIAYSTNDHDVMTNMDDFKHLVELAKSDMEKGTPQQNTQAVVLESQSGHIYHAVIMNVLTDDLLEENELLNQMKQQNDTEIKRIVCMWEEGCFDMPSYAFRKLMCEMNAQNIHAEMFLLGDKCFIKKTIFETLAPIDRKRYQAEQTAHT